DRELERQIHAYSRGHVAYHLTILLRHRDFRALRRLMLDLPLHDARSLWRLARGRNQFPFSFIRAEIGGHLTGAWALWRSSLRVRRLGRSAPLERLPTGSVSAGPGLPSAEMHPPDPKKANGRRQSSSASSPRERHPQGADEPDTPLVGSAPDNT